MSDQSESAVVTVGKGVEARIRDASLSQREFTLLRNYGDWDLALKDFGGLQLREDERLRVDVVTHTTEQGARQVGRNAMSLLVPVDIGVRKKFVGSDIDPASNSVRVEKVDELMLFVEELFMLFPRSLMTDFKDAVWDEEGGGAQIIAAPIKQNLRDYSQFTAIIRIHFRVTIPIKAE